MQRGLQQLFFDILWIVDVPVVNRRSQLFLYIGGPVAFLCSLDSGIRSCLFFREISTQFRQMIENERLICPKGCPKAVPPVERRIFASQNEPFPGQWTPPFASLHRVSSPHVSKDSVLLRSNAEPLLTCRPTDTDPRLAASQCGRACPTVELSKYDWSPR